jgi:hypothetical protein
VQLPYLITPVFLCEDNYVPFTLILKSAWVDSPVFGVAVA